MESIKNFINQAKPDEFSNLNPFADIDDGFNFGKYFSLSYEQRIYGFVISSAIGLLCSLMGTISIFFMNLVAFGVLYSIGDIAMIMSTMFLVGPMRQIKNMFDAKRVIATSIFIISIILTLCAAFAWKNGALCIIFLVIQMCAFLWYTLSYIPYGRDLFCNCMKNVV